MFSRNMPIIERTPAEKNRIKQAAKFNIGDTVTIKGFAGSNPERKKDMGKIVKIEDNGMISVDWINSNHLYSWLPDDLIIVKKVQK